MGNPRGNPMSDRKFTLLLSAAAAASAGIFLAWLGRYLFLDFFYDEIFSLTHYILVPLKTTLTDVTFANNHVFSNVLGSLYFSVIGARDLNLLLDRPWMARALYAAYGIAAILLTWCLAKRFFNAVVAAIAVIVLTTTIPFYNFCVQVRGYSLSITVCAFLVYMLWRFEETGLFQHGAAVAAATACLFYIMPSNLYLILGMGVFYAASFAGGKLQRRKTAGDGGPGAGKRKKSSPMRPGAREISARWWNSRDMRPMLVLSAGFAIGVLLSAPFLGTMLADPDLRSRGMLHFPTLFRTMPWVLYAFVSWRFLLLIAGAWGCALLFLHRAAHRNDGWRRRAAFCLTMLVVPFAASFVRGDAPYDRSFIPLIPVFVIALSAGVYVLFERWLPGKAAWLWGVGLTLLYCHATFAGGIMRIRHTLHNDIVAGAPRRQNLLYNYFQSDYHPHETVRIYRQKFASETIPLIVGECDQSAFFAYLNRENVFVADAHDLRKIVVYFDSVYVFSAERSLVNGGILAKNPKYAMKYIGTKPDFQNLFLMYKNTR